MPEWPASTPRDEMLARVVRRGRHLRRLRMLAIGAATVLVAAGGVVGYQLGTSGAVDLLADGTIDAGGVPVDYHACPGSGAAGRLHRGDRVLVTGVDADGTWLQLRSPLDPHDRVWVPAAVVTADDDLEVPVVEECRLDDGTTLELAGGEIVTTTTTDTTVAAGETTTTDTTEPGSDPTVALPPTTTRPGPTPTTSPGPGPTTAPSTPATPPPDTSGPVVGTVSRQHASLYEDHHHGAGCSASSPLTGWVRAAISDPESGVASATMTWTVRNPANDVIHQGSRPMTRIAGPASAGTWQATLGPFEGDVLPGMSTDQGRITIQITTLNGDGAAGTPATRADFVTLRDCTFG